MLEDLVSKYDRKLPKYDLLAIGLMPQEMQENSFLLHHFFHEIDQISKKISEAMIGEIRLEWWREIFTQTTAKDPLSEAMLSMIEKHHLPVQKFLDFLDAKSFDLYSAPIGSISDFEIYCGKSMAAILQMTQLANHADISQQASDISGHLGIAYQVHKILAQFSYLKTASKQYIPAEIFMNIGLNPNQFFTIKEKSKENELMQEFLIYGIAHFEKARAAFQKLSKQDQKTLFFAYLPILQSKYFFINASSAGEDLIAQHPVLQQGQFKYQLSLLKDVMFKATAFKI